MYELDAISGERRRHVKASLSQVPNRIRDDTEPLDRGPKRARKRTGDSGGGGDHRREAVLVAKSGVRPDRMDHSIPRSNSAVLADDPAHFGIVTRGGNSIVTRQFRIAGTRCHVGHAQVRLPRGAAVIRARVVDMPEVVRRIIPPVVP
jgi:hypothetical protein